jgi:hypothetical protein
MFRSYIRYIYNIRKENDMLWEILDKGDERYTG